MEVWVECINCLQRFNVRYESEAAEKHKCTIECKILPLHKDRKWRYCPPPGDEVRNDCAT